MSYTDIQRAQMAWDNRAEPDYDEDRMTPDDAYEQAMQELESTPKIIAEWLAGECYGNWDSYDTLKGTPKDGMKVPELLALLFGGYKDHEKARMYLVERFREAHRDIAQDNSEEILAKDARLYKGDE